MELEDRRIIEVFLGAIFIVLLIMMVLIGLRPTPSNFTTTNVIVSDSFNTEYDNYKDDRYGDKVYYRDYRYKDDNFKYRDYNCDRYDRCYDRDDYKERYLRFDARSTHRVRDLGFGTGEYDEYKVYVENEDYVGGYFSVMFYFYDRYGNEDTAYLTKYIGPRKEAAFVYKDLNYGSRYYDWDYEVTSESKIPRN